MALVTTNAGELVLIDQLLAVEDRTFKLFKNDATAPSATSVIGDFTVADFTGYSNVTLDKDDWQNATNVGGKAVAVYGTDPLTWTNGGSSQTIYGYTIQNAGGTLLWAEKFPVAKVLGTGEPLNVTPTFSGNSES